MWKRFVLSLGLCAALVCAVYAEDQLTTDDIDTHGEWDIRCGYPAIPANCSVSQGLISDAWPTIWAQVNVVFNVFNEPEMEIVVPGDIRDNFIQVGLDTKRGPEYSVRCGDVCRGDFRIGKGWIMQAFDKKMIWITWRMRGGALTTLGFQTAGLEVAINAVLDKKPAPLQSKN